MGASSRRPWWRSDAADGPGQRPPSKRHEAIEDQFPVAAMRNAEFRQEARSGNVDQWEPETPWYLKSPLAPGLEYDQSAIGV